MANNKRGNKIKSYRLGLLAEQFAAWGLRLRGFRILAQRYKTPVGEIDLIARKGSTLAFVEVKARADLSTALESVTPRMQGRIVKAANYFIAQNSALAGCDMRFDLVAVAPPFYWRHLDNAWRPST